MDFNIGEQLVQQLRFTGINGVVASHKSNDYNALQDVGTHLLLTITTYYIHYHYCCSSSL